LLTSPNLNAPGGIAVFSGTGATVFGAELVASATALTFARLTAQKSVITL
jgi:hypothetical protein